MTLLAIDIGNTRLKWAQYASLMSGREPVAQGAAFLETIDRLAEPGGDWAAAKAPFSLNRGPNVELGYVKGGTGAATERSL